MGSQFKSLLRLSINLVKFYYIFVNNASFFVYYVEILNKLVLSELENENRR